MKEKIKGKNKKKLQLILLFRILFYPFLFIFDKINVLKYFVGIINFILKKFRIKKVFNSQFTYRIYSAIFRKQFDRRTIDKIILFPFMHGSNSSFNLRSLLIAKYMDNKGYRPVLLICDGIFSICNHDRIGKDRRFIPLFCASCFNHYDYVQKVTGIEIKYFSEFYDSEKQDAIVLAEKARLKELNTIEDLIGYKFKGSELGKLTKTSVLRYFHRGNISGTKIEIEVYKKYLIESIKTYLLCERLFASIPEIEKVILFNGALSFDLIFAEFCKKNSIDYITQETFIGNNSWIYKKNGIAIHLNWDNEWDRYKQTKISDHQKEQVLDLFSGFRTGKDVGIRYNDEQKIKLDFLYPGQRYVALFTNLNFDTYTLGRDPVFNSMYEWVISTINYWNKNVEDIKLIVRAHPAEIKLLTPTQDFVSNIIDDRLSDKIIFLDSTDEINSYDLFDRIEYGICYASTIGIELKLANKPVIVAGEAFYKEYVLNPETKTEYFHYIEKLNLGKLIDINNNEGLYNYLYFIYFNRTKKFKGFYFDRIKGHDVFKNKSFDELFRMNYQVLDEFYNYAFGDY